MSYMPMLHPSLTKEQEESIFNDICIKKKAVVFNIINKQKKIIEVQLNMVEYCEESTNLHIGLFYKYCLLITFSFSIDTYNSFEKFLTILNLVKNYKFCLDPFCPKIINSASFNTFEDPSNLLINDKCVSCILNDSSGINCNDECSICLEYNDTTSTVLYCDHTFHKKCIKKASNENEFKITLKCPLCRTSYYMNRQMTIIGIVSDF